MLSSVVLLVAPRGGAEPVPEPLGGHPVCEASAATLIACPGDPDATCLLVGDCEQRQALFAYPFDGHRLDVQNRSTLDIRQLLHGGDDRELSDIEALTRLSSGDVLLYGSHSRNKGCERKKSRRRYLSLRFEGGDAAAGGVALRRTKKGFDLEKAIPGDATGDLKRVRKAFAAAEREADEASEGAGSCPPQALNIEGVVALPEGAGDEVWIGLRAPTVDGKAALLRQAGKLEKLAFDRARLVDLGGRGVRDLTYSRGWIWGLAGPVPDSEGVDFVLWRFRAAALAGRRVIEVKELGAVTGSSEGLAIWGNTAIVVIDGDGPEGQPACARDAAYVTVAVPW